MPPVYAVAAAVVAGDALGNCHLSAPLWLAVLIAIAAVLSFLVRRAHLGTALALLAIGAAAGASVHHVLDPPRDAISIRRFGDGAAVAIEGRLVREAERYQGRLHLYLKVERASRPGEALGPASGSIRVTVLKPGDYRIGDRVRLTAKLRWPRNFGNPGEFDYEAYLAREGIAATAVVPNASAIEVVDRSWAFPSSAIESIRARCARLIDSNLDYPEREEMRALVIGDRGGIGRELREAFALTGMAHLLVISGLHLSLVAAAAFASMRVMLSFVPTLTIRGWTNKATACGAGIAVAGYAAIAGHHVSTVRALVMVISYVAAVTLDRSREVLASLALAAMVICLWLPGSTADIGFQLSFVSVLAIVLGMRRYEAWWRSYRERTKFFPRRMQRLARIAAGVGGYVAVSFWALTGTAALTAYHFNQFSMVGIIANAVVVPIMGGAGTVGGLCAALIGSFFPQGGALMMRLAGRCLAAGTVLARWFAAWPGAWVRVFTPTPIELALVYALLLMWLTAPLKAAARPGEHAIGPQPSAAPRWRRRCLAMVLAALVVDGGYWTYDRYFNRALRVTFLSVGQGDGAVVRFPGSRVMLIDAGGSFSDEFDPGERMVAAYLWSRKIMHVDYLVLTHPELDHFGGFNFVARNFTPSEFWTIAASSPDIKYEALLEVLAAAGVRLRLMDSGAPPEQIGGVGIDCLNPAPILPPRRNDSSMMLMLSLGPNRILFTGDVEARGEEAVIARGNDLRATVLKVPHHGSDTSSTPVFIAAVRPAVAIISLGYRNRYDFPSAAVVRRYREAGARVIRTDECGAVTIAASASGAWLDAGGCIASGAESIASAEERWR
jgi:competence protein ComEC